MNELYGLPEGWEWKKLDSIVKFSQGIQVSIKDQLEEYKDGFNTFIRIINYTQQSNEFRFIKKFSEKSYVTNDDIVMIRYGATAGFVGRGLEGIIANNMFRVIPMRDKELSKDYLYLFLISNIVQSILVKNIGAAAMPAINFKTMSLINIPLPPLQEQKRIVAKLDSLFAKIDQAITLHQQNIDEAEGFMGSVLNEVFGELDTNTKIPLKEITTKIGSGSTPRGGQKSYKTEGISLIRSMNVHDAGFRTKGLAFIDDEQAKKLNNVTIEENDVLLNITGASVARCCIVDKAYLPARVNQHVSILRLKEDMLPEFLHYYLISPSVKADLLFGSSGGATREAITKSMLESFEVPFIPIETQQKTVQYLDQLSQKTETLKQVQREKMESLKALKASILDRAFRGEL